MKKININNFDEKLFYEKLSNGLEVYLIPLKTKKSFFAFFGTKFGGIDLTFKVNDKKYTVPAGIAHFLEHKLFEQDKSPFDFYGQTGTDVNASTSNKYTGYYFSGNNNFNANLKYLLNWITNFHITEEQVKKEQGIILEEAKMYKDNPDRIIYEKIRENSLIASNYKEKVIGTLDSIVKITKEDLYLCYKSFYRPDNMFIIITGNFNEKETINIIKEELNNFKNLDEVITKIYPEEKDEVKIEKEVLKMPIEIPKVSVSYKINKHLFDSLNIDKYNIDYYLQMILTLAFGSTSDFREYLLKKELFLSIGNNITDIGSHYLIEFYATSNKPKELIEELLKFINNIKNLSINEEDFIRIKKTWISSEIRMIDNISTTLYNVLEDILEYKEYKNNTINDKKNLTYENLKRVIDKLNFENKSILIIEKCSNNK